MLTIGLGAIFRSFASMTWGSEIYTLPTPVQRQARPAWAASPSATSTCRSSSAPWCCAPCSTPSSRTRKVGVAMQAASQNQLAAYYMGIPVKRMFSLIWAISAGRGGDRRRAAGAGLADRRQHRLHRAQGLRGGRAGRLRLHPRRARRRPHHRRSSSCSPALTCRTGFKDVAALRRPAGRCSPCGRRACSAPSAARRSDPRMRFVFKTVVRAGPGPLPRRRAAQLVRGLLVGAARAAAAGAGRTWSTSACVFIYGLVRALAHGAGRLHRAGQPRPRRLPRHRRLRPRLLRAGSRAAVGARRGAGGRAHRGGRRARRPAGAADDGRLPDHRHAGLRAHHPGGLHPLGAR